MEIRTLTTPQDLFAAAAEEVMRAANEAVAQRGRFTIALSGGSTPKNLFNLLATNARTVLPWDRMFFFWGDERHVPPDRSGEQLPHGGREPAVEDSGSCREMCSAFPRRIPMPRPRRKPTSRLCRNFLRLSPDSFRASI